MKKLYFLLGLLSGAANSQTINFPDANLKNKLLSAASFSDVAASGGNYVKIDTNDDGEIQLAEAAVIDSIRVSGSSISDLTGIQSFTNLKKLKCDANSLTSINFTGLNLMSLVCNYNSIASLDVSSMPNLQRLNCSSNNMTNLVVAGLANLETLECQENSLASLDLTGLTGLETFYFLSNHLTSLDISGLVSLKQFWGGANPMPSIDASGLTNLEWLYYAEIAGPQGTLSSLDVTGCTGLRQLEVGGNVLTSLDLSGCNSLEYLNVHNNHLTSLTMTSPVLNTLYCSTNNLTSLDLSALTGLETLYCMGNDFTVLDVSGLQTLKLIKFEEDSFNPGGITSFNAAGCTALESVYGMYNQLSSVNFSDCPALFYVHLMGNQLPTIDFSDNPALYYAVLDNNASLQSIFMKNGKDDVVSVIGCPLQYICADDFQVAEIQTMLNANGMDNVACNSYCNFEPGGTYNTVTGNSRLDLGGNGCDSSDMPFSLLKIGLDDGVSQGSVFSSNTGNYVWYVQQPNLTLTPQFENPSYFNFAPASQIVNFAAIDGSTQIADFCVTPNGIHNDVEVYIVPTVAARPGFDAVYEIIYRNKGNQALSGTIDFDFDDDVIDFLGSTVIPDVVSSGTLSWNYNALLPFETRTFTLTFNVNSPIEIPAVNIGDELSYVATINPVSGDEIPQDNQFAYKQTVVGSFDPNDKLCLQGDVVPTAQIGGFLTYVINFENTGNFPAQNVVIKDLIDTDKFDISSLELLGTSHQDNGTVTGNKLEIVFANIDLAPGEYGYVAFKIKTLNTLVAGTEVTNKANIYFDFNFPVETNTASSTFENLAVGDHSGNAGLGIFPNPVSDRAFINSADNIRTIRIYDLWGRTVARYDGNRTSLDFSGCASGIYYVCIETDSRKITQKLVKQ